METKELSPAMLQAQVTVVATLGELLDTLPTWEEMLMLKSPKCLHWDLGEFTEELWVTLQRTENTWRRHIVTDDGDGGVTSLSQALAAYRSAPQTTQDRVAMAASEWQWSVNLLVDSWAQLNRKASELRDTWSEVATEAMTAQFREIEDKDADDGTSEEHGVELGQALGREEGTEVLPRPEFQVKREARVAASETIVATMGRQRVWAVLGLLERLVAACDEAAAFPRELQRLLRDTEITLEGTNEASSDVMEDSVAACDEATTFLSSLWRMFWHPKATLKGTKKKFPDVPEDLMAKVAMAEQLWEASARLAKDHLLGTVEDILDYSSKGGGSRPSARELAERCQRAIEDIPRLLRHLECAQHVPKVSPVSMDIHELSLALLQPQVTVVATLGKLLATLPRQEEEMLLKSSKRLHRGLEEFTKELRVTLHCIDDTWRRHIVTDDGDGDPLTSLSQALAAYKSTPRTTSDHVAMAASEWQGSVAVIVNSWAELARKATELRDTCRVAVTEAATARAREQQDQAARDGTALERTGELGQALGGEEGAEVAARPQSPVRKKARVAASEATTAPTVRQRLEAALGLLERLVAACDEATAFPRELQLRVGDIKATLEGTNEASPGVPEGLAAKVAVAERLWEANARLAKDHLLGIIDDFLDYYSRGGRARPSAHEVAKWCQRATEDIRNLLQG